MTDPAWLCRLGRQPYGPVEALQHRLVEARAAGTLGDGVLMLEHEPVITLGRRADPTHVLAPPEVLAREGIEVRHTERGGDVTYHGPGQLVGYPILHLPTLGLGASDYMHTLEDALSAALADFGVRTQRRQGVIGVWVGENKIAALGVRIRHGVCFHGWALNVAPNMRHWGYIIPCGITDGGVTSLAQELGQAPPLARVSEVVAAHLGAALGLRLVDTPLEALAPAAGPLTEPVGRA